jgi:peptidase M3-like protein
MRAGTFGSQESAAAFRFTAQTFYTIFRFPINQSFPFEKLARRCHFSFACACSLFEFFGHRVVGLRRLHFLQRGNFRGEFRLDSGDQLVDVRLGAGAGYYGYAWADAIAADMATVFEQAKDGYLDKNAGMRLRQEIYQQGDSRDVNVSIEKFLGRKQSIDPFLKKIGIGSEGKTKPPPVPPAPEAR